MHKVVNPLKLLFFSSKIAQNPIPFHRKWFGDGDSVFFIFPFLSKVFLTRNAKIAQEVLLKKHRFFDKSKIQSVLLAKFIGRGLLTSNGDYWLQQRRLIQPGFHKKKIELLLEGVETAVAAEVSKFSKGKTQDLHATMGTLTFRVLTQSVFTIDFDQKTLEFFYTTLKEIEAFFTIYVRQPHKSWWYFVTGAIRKYENKSKQIRDLIQSIIEERQQSDKEYNDLLDMLLHAAYEDGSKMTMNQLIDEIIILFVAGHETSANALCFTLFLLSKNPKALKKLTVACKKEEAQKKSAVEKIASLKYAKAVIEESMRMYPPAWIVDRVSKEDCKLGKHQIKKGTLIGISIYEIHHHPKYWESPEKFLPERFLSENAKALQQYYFPFGAGPRLCIGNNFAMYEMILALSKIVTAWDFEIVQDTVLLQPEVTLKPKEIEIVFKEKTSI